MLVKLAAIFFSIILVNNYELLKFYGISPFLRDSNKLDSSILDGLEEFFLHMGFLKGK